MKGSHYDDGSYGPVDIFRRPGLSGIKVNKDWGISDKPVKCPNCGASFSKNSKCQYCGSEVASGR